MNIGNFMFNILMAYILFFVNAMLGKMQLLYRNIFEYEIFSFAPNSKGSYSGNFFQLIINPTVFISIVCALLQQIEYDELCFSLWLVVPLYWLLRFLYYVAKSRLSYVNWIYEIFSFIISNGLSLLICFGFLIPLVKGNKSVFFPVESFRDAIWFAIMSYIAKTIWDIGKCALKADSIFSDRRKEKIIKAKRQKFCNRYKDNILDALKEYGLSSNAEVQNLIYAIMIYEDYNRPVLFRAIEHIIKKLFPKRTMTLGIMQFKTSENINDIHSVILGTTKIAEAYCRNLEDSPAEKAIIDYNNSKSYLSEVISIFNVLKNEHGRDCQNDA